MTQTEDFFITVNENEYQCRRVFILDTVSTQEIFVEGSGSKEDSHPYEIEQVDSMPAAARRLAKEIIEEHSVR